MIRLALQFMPEIYFTPQSSGDGAVGVNDMLTILSYFGSNTVVGNADVDSDGTVGVNDMLLFLSLFGTSCVQ